MIKQLLDHVNSFIE